MKILHSEEDGHSHHGHSHGHSHGHGHDHLHEEHHDHQDKEYIEAICSCDSPD